MTTSIHSQRIIAPEDLGALALSSAVNAVVGTTSTKIVKPAGAHILVLTVSSGNGFNVAVGDRSSTGTNDMPATLVPAASISDGSAALPLLTGVSMILPGPDVVTVKGYVATDALTYWWL